MIRFFLIPYHIYLYLCRHQQQKTRCPNGHLQQIAMEKGQDTTLMKARSYRRVLRAGFQLYNNHFRAFFKASWQMALVYALVSAALGTLSSIKIPELSLVIIQQIVDYQGVFIEPLMQYGITLLELILLILLAIAALALGSANILAKLKEHKENGTITMPAHWLTASPQLMGRTLKGVFATLLVVALPYLLVLALLVFLAQTQPEVLHGRLITAIVTASIATIVITAFALPLMHVLMKYIMESPAGYWHTLSKHYGRGLHHWGMLFLVFFVSTLVVQISTLVVMMPAHILNMANQTAHMGLLKGDPLGMPSYITTLTFITFALCCFIQFYVSHITLLHNYFAYGSIEAKEQEKQEHHQQNLL